MSTAQVAPTVQYDFYQDTKDFLGSALNFYAQKEIAKAQQPDIVAVEQAQTFGTPGINTETAMNVKPTVKDDGIVETFKGLPGWGQVAVGVTSLVVVGGIVKKATA